MVGMSGRGRASNKMPGDLWSELALLGVLLGAALGVAELATSRALPR